MSSPKGSLVFISATVCGLRAVVDMQIEHTRIRIMSLGEGRDEHTWVVLSSLYTVPEMIEALM